MSTPTLGSLMREHALTVDATFVPWSRSRSAARWLSEHRGKSLQDARVTDKSLNWVIDLWHAGNLIVTTDYSAGIAHCPAYADPRSGPPGFLSVTRADNLTFEVERGFVSLGSLTLPLTREAIRPDAEDVLACLVEDTDALDHGTFESFAEHCGYDPDSRKAERIYRTCLEQSLKLRAGLGDRLLSALRKAAWDR